MPPQQNPAAPVAQQNPAAQPVPPMPPAGAMPTGPAPAQPTPPKPKANSTQNSLKIAEIRDGLVILQDGSYRAVVLAQSINFDLMSNQEREAVEGSYQQFLNSLYFPIQIMLRSYRVDLKTYMTKLKKLYAEQDNVLLGLLMEDYISYVEYLTSTSNIMEKQFYIVVPFYPGATGAESYGKTQSGFGGTFGKKQSVVKVKEKDFNDAKDEMRQRVSSILSAMDNMNVQAVPLNTQELIELYYNVYNPETATVQTLASHHELEADIITKGTGEATRADLQEIA